MRSALFACHVSPQLPPAVTAPAEKTPAAAGPGPSLHRPLPRDAQHVDAIAMAAAEQLVAACTAGRGLAPPSELQRRCRRQRQPPAPPLLGTNVRVARRPQAVPDHSAWTYGCELASWCSSTPARRRRAAPLSGITLRTGSPAAFLGCYSVCPALLDVLCLLQGCK